jgi:lipid II:glycine glycyltransferase (peptidoglycan interpeptide bridge formation enzyme)
MKTYNLTDQPDREKWSDFVLNHPKGTIFQTPEMFDVLAATKNNEPGLVAAVDSDGRPVGLMVYTIQEESGGLLGRLSARSIVRGGPLALDDNKEIIQSLINHYNKHVKPKAIYTQYRNFWDQEKEIELFKKNGFKYEEHLNILVNLEKSEDELWKDVHSKRRNEIRRARKEGTTARELTTHEELETSYRILNDVYTRAKLPLHDKTMFDAATKILHPKGMIRFFGAINGGKIIGTIVVLCYKQRVFDWYAGSYREHYNKYPNDLLPWEVFLWGKKNGYTLFDFGGAGKPGVPYGVRDYKKKFGGTFVNYGRYEKIHKPLLMKAASAGFKLWRKIR